MAEAERLFIAMARRRPMREVEEVLAVCDKGFQNCVHGCPGSRRQVLLMEDETLARLHLEPGVVRENITTRGLRLRELSAGQRLRVGNALLEVTIPCEPCDRMDEIRTGLQEELHGQRGVLCRVVKSGLIRRGAEIQLVASASAG